MGLEQLAQAVDAVREGLRRGAQTGASLHSPGWTGEAARTWQRELERACTEQAAALAGVERLRSAVEALRVAAAAAAASGPVPAGVP